MTTNTTNSPAASIADDPDFQSILTAIHFAVGPKSLASASKHLCSIIDAKLAQAREEGVLFERKRLVQTIGNANDLSSECLKQRDEANSRATAAESRLAEIQRGVEGIRLRQYGHYYDADEVNAILALIHSSGLPG